MKKSLALLLFGFILGSINNSNDLLNILELNTFEEQYNSLLEAFETLEKIKSTVDNKKFGEMLSDIIRILMNEYKDKKNFTQVKKLENLLSRLETFSFMNLAAKGFFYLDKGIIDFLRDKKLQNSDEFLHFLNKITTAPIDPFVKLSIIVKFYKKAIEYVKSMNAFSDKIKFFFKHLRYFGNAISTVSNSISKFAKCQKRDEYAMIISTFQGIANVGTNMIFGTIGSILGTFIPIPIARSLIGGAIGNYLGSLFNSLYDFDY